MRVARPRERGGCLFVAGCLFCLFGCFVLSCLRGRDGEGDVISLRT